MSGFNDESSLKQNLIERISTNIGVENLENRRTNCVDLEEEYVRNKTTFSSINLYFIKKVFDKHFFIFEVNLQRIEKRTYPSFQD